MILLSELLGHQAMDISTAVATGKVIGIGLTADRVVSVGLGGDVIDAAAVRGFDGDVVTYQPGSVAPATRLAAPIDPRGSKVLDRHGDLLGRIAD
ncbi:MAG: hypothetical protein OEW29_16960, partial [Acidimicrobiia bacterium]|nr:hypothetical protein [Acidimicrobiia bacterium]